MKIYMVFEEYWHHVDGGQDKFLKAYFEEDDAKLYRQDMINRCEFINDEWSVITYVIREEFVE